MTITTNSDIGGKITQAMKVGSGVDIQDLATQLAEAESTPKIDAVTKKKEASKVSVSGFGLLKTAVSNLKASYDGLKDKDTLLTKAVSSSNTDQIGAEITSQSLAVAGTTRIAVHQLARPEITEIKTAADGTFASASASISGLTSITLTSGGVSSAISIPTATPAGIVQAINDANFNGIKAKTINKSATGTAVSVILTGKTGQANSFTVDSNLSGGSELTFQQDQSALNLKVRLDNDKITGTDSGDDNIQLTERDNNSPSDLIEGVQLTFKWANSAQTRNIVVSANSAALETKVNDLIESYNSIVNVSKYLTGKKDVEDELAGSLSGDKNTVNLVMGRIRDLVGLTSTTASNGYSTLRDLGVSTQMSGELSLDKTTYDAAIKSNFSDIRTMLTADTNDQLASDSANKGLALDSSIVLDGIVKNAGTINTKEKNATDDVSRYEDELADLNEKLTEIKNRYLKQFAAMESLVQRSKNTGEYLTSQFKAMESMYSGR